MATYLIEEEAVITRQEGDIADVEITVPSELPLDGHGVTFQVKAAGGRVLINKKDTTNTLTITDQDIYIPLLPADTRGKDGVHRWELQVDTEDGPITIGRGDFRIIK